MCGHEPCVDQRVCEQLSNRSRKFLELLLAGGAEL